jgi:hypothetical protein
MRLSLLAVALSFAALAFSEWLVRRKGRFTHD